MTTEEAIRKVASGMLNSMPVFMDHWWHGYQTAVIQFAASINEELRKNNQQQGNNQ